MKWVRITLIVVLQISCIYSAVLLVKNRRAWMGNVRHMKAQHVDNSDMEARVYPEIGMVANWPVQFGITTGDPGLPPMILSLLLLFASLPTMGKGIGQRFTVYAAAFFVILLAFHLVMILQQNNFLQGIYDGNHSTETSENAGYTTAHGFVYWVVDPSNPDHKMSLPRFIAARDPNVIPVLLIAGFLCSWLPFSTARRKAARPST